MPEHPLAFLLAPKEPPKRSPVGQKMDVAFDCISKLYTIVPAAHSTTPALAAAALHEMETFLLEAAEHLRQAQADIEFDPVAATTPVPVRKEVTP